MITSRIRFATRSSFLAVALTLATVGACARGQDYRENERARVEGVAPNNAEVVCNAILDKLVERYGRPKTWRTFPVKFQPGGSSQLAGYTLYSYPEVKEVVIYQTLEEANGRTLDHELTHAFFFYYVDGNFDLFLNEGLAQNSETKSRRKLREEVWRRARLGLFAPLDSLYGANRYDNEFNLYVQGFSVVDFLLARAGSKWFAAFLVEVASSPERSDRALMRFYNYPSIHELENAWLKYVREGQNQRRIPAI